MKPIQSNSYFLNAALLGFLVAVILKADPTLYPTFRLAAAILCAVAAIWSLLLILRPRLPDFVGGQIVAVPLWARLTFLSGGFAGLWFYLFL